MGFVGILTQRCRDNLLGATQQWQARSLHRLRAFFHAHTHEVNIMQGLPTPQGGRELVSVVAVDLPRGEKGRRRQRTSRHDTRRARGSDTTSDRRGPATAPISSALTAVCDRIGSPGHGYPQPPRPRRGMTCLPRRSSGDLTLIDWNVNGFSLREQVQLLASFEWDVACLQEMTRESWPAFRATADAGAFAYGPRVQAEAPAKSSAPACPDRVVNPPAAASAGS